MNDLSGYFCAFSWADGQHKRYFRLAENGIIEDLFGSEGNNNERRWRIEENTGGGAELLLTAPNGTITSRFRISRRGADFVELSGMSIFKIGLRLFCVRRQNDLFELKTKFTNAADIERGTLTVGPHSYGHIVIYEQQFGGKVRIGNYCSIAGGTKFMLAGHRTDLITTYPFGVLKTFTGIPVSEPDHLCRGDIVIGNDVWIGADTMILSGVTVGDGAVIAAHSVVNKDVEPYAVVGGVPAKPLKYRIDNETHRRQMQQIAWWNWPDDTVAERIGDIMSSDIAAFVGKYS